MRYVVIMAGGSGTRLWPLSRKGTPKQLLKLISGQSLLQLAYERASRVVPPERIVVVTGEAYLDAVARELPALPAENLLGEPEGRDSLNACAWPAAVLLRRDPDAVIAQLTADHIIEPVDAFAGALDQAFTIAESSPDVLVTLGVVPTSAHTGYGYLQRGEPLADHPGACAVANFKEKPPLATAAMYVTSGDYWWNAGMFVWRASTFLEQLRLLEPTTYADIMTLADHPGRLAEIFPTLTKISVDYAILEPVAHGKASARVVAVPLGVDWRDVGGFASLGELLPSDSDDNASNALIQTLDATNNIVLDHSGSGQLIALVGVSDLVIVQTPDAILVATKDQAEKVKALVAKIAESAPDYA